MQTHFWNPWSLFDELERTFYVRESSSAGPAFEVEDDEDATTISADVPGMTEDDLEITLAGGMMTVRGERKARNGTPRPHGAFERRFRIADGYDLDDVRAGIEHGVLTIRLPKTARMKPRRIKLGTGMLDKVKGFLSGDKDKEA